MHARWCGHAIWLPLDNEALGLPIENVTSYPAPGHGLLYAGGTIDSEILLACSVFRFHKRRRAAAGDHFLTVVEGLGELRALGMCTIGESR